MPMDDWFNQATHDHEFNRHCVGTELKFSFIPRQCYVSGKKLWLTWAYRRTAMWTGPGDPIFEHRWYDKTEFIIERLKNKV